MDTKAWIGTGATIIGLAASGWAVARANGSSDTRTEMLLNERAAGEKALGERITPLEQLPAKINLLDSSQKNNEASIQRLEGTVNELSRDFKELLKSQRAPPK